MKPCWNRGAGRPCPVGVGADSSSEEALQALFMLQSFFSLPLRALAGFSRSLLTLLRVDLPVPDYSTLCRRRQTLESRLASVPRLKADEQPLHLVIDSSGLKVFGEGEWKVRQHGIGKRRTWRKLHIAVDEKSAEIVAATASGPEVTDAEALPSSAHAGGGGNPPSQPGWRL